MASNELKEQAIWKEESVASCSIREGPELSDSHRKFLMDKYGTVALDPLPSEDPGDPLNWAPWKKNMNLTGVAIQNMGGVLMCTTIVPSLVTISEALNVSFASCTYFSTIPILFLGVSTLFWKPLAGRYGRRPVWLVSTFLAAIFALASAFCNTYSSLMVMRVFSGIFHAPALSIGGATVGETFFAKDRGKKIGLWSLAFTIGPAIGPLLGGVTLYHTNNWRWSFWLMVIYNFMAFVFAFFFCPETLYDRTQQATTTMTSTPTGFADQYLKVRRINKAKFSLYEIVEPFMWARYPPVVVAFLAHGIANTLTGPGITIVLPRIYQQVYGLNAQQIGLQYFSMMIGFLVGNLVGPISDYLMNKKRAASSSFEGSRSHAEFRLWAGYVGYALTIAGMLEYGIMLTKAKRDHWTVIPDIGVALACAGNQIIATVVITYAIDKMGAANSGTVANSIHQYRQLFGFVTSFYLNPMYDNLGTAGAAGLMAGLIGITALPMMYMHIFGSKHVYEVLSVEAKTKITT